MQSVVAKGKSIQEAVQVGIDLMEVTKKEVNIEILQAPSKGFMKIGSKEAVVRLTKLETAVTVDTPIPAQRESHDLKEPADHVVEESDDWFSKAESFVSGLDIDKIEIRQPEVKKTADHSSEELLLKNGSVWVKDGKLMMNPGTEKLPVVSIPKGIRLYRNQKLIEEPLYILSPKDEYRIAAIDEEKDTEWSLEVSPDKLKAFLHVNPGYIIKRTVDDLDPLPQITLTYSEDRTIKQTLTEAMVKEAMQERSILQNIDHIELLRAMRNGEPSDYTIARGVAPSEGKDGWLELKVDTDVKEGLKEGEHGKVNFRETKVFPMIDTGEIIAVVHPPEEGSTGYSVYSESLSPKPVFPIVLRLGKGVKLIGDHIVAKEFGRPHIESKGQLVKISIMPKLLHNGDVNLSSGNISFLGDIEITGEIDTGMKVEAQGNLVIGKNIQGSVCTATGSIIVAGNITASDVSAGKNNMITSKLSMLTGVLKQDVDRIIAVIIQLINSPSFKTTDFPKGGLQPLVRILLEKKFNDFIPRAKLYVQLVREGKAQLDDERWKETAEQISSLFLTLSTKAVSIDVFTHLSHHLGALHEESEMFDESKSSIECMNVLNSRIHAGGDLYISGQSCIHSRIHSGGFMTINGSLRGGEAYAEKGIYIGETGAESGTPTNLAVPSGAVIKIGNALEGTILRIGNRKVVLTQDYSGLKARLNAGGMIELR
ncbi:FapA family protein [Jeotgalibacillus aurantiacus]|uniref:FapA family protein n=1 Tax=Jeotgalibacillus aurantiacus TaxID=2763266 RepID=UPI001D0AC7B6|nr:FapA family protein [Jeotgalibacillus aurantiacus]